MTDPKFKEKLNRMLEKTKQAIPPWLEELLALGPRLEQYPPVGMRPNRVILTEFLARWLKYAGLSHDECLEWLELYSCEVLREYSKSGMSAIRHGTKANVRWVYSSPFQFDFEAMVRDLPTTGFEGKPLYMPLFKRWYELLWEAKDNQRKAYVPPVFLPVIPKKKRFFDQYKKGVALARQQMAEGTSLTRMVELLNEQGYLTRTGRKWTIGTLKQSLVRTVLEERETNQTS